MARRHGRGHDQSLGPAHVRQPARPGGYRPARRRPPLLHRHEYSETFRFLEGDFEVGTLDTNDALGTVEVTAGDTISILSMAWHNFKNVGATPGKFLAIHSPAMMEEFVREIVRPIADPHNPPEPGGLPSEEERHRMMEIIQKYMEILPPDETTKGTRR